MTPFWTAWITQHYAISSWLFIIVTVCILQLAGNLVIRVLRTVNIICRGWPPIHLDADGDQIESEPQQRNTPQ